MIRLPVVFLKLLYFFELLSFEKWDIKSLKFQTLLQLGASNLDS